MAFVRPPPKLYPTEITFGVDLDAFPTPLCRPTADSSSVLIVGGGVTGLTTAWILLDQGYNVTIISKEWASYGSNQRLTSQIAGALWEFPPAVCGHHTDEMSIEHSKRWSMISYHIFAAISASKNLSRAAGVQMKPANFFFPKMIEDSEEHWLKMKEIEASGVQGFRRTVEIIQQRSVHEGYGAVDAYEHLAPIIDTDQSMIFLMKLVTSKGARLVTKTVHGDLLDLEDELRRDFSADVIINATGLGSYETAGDDSCYPLRGALIRMINNGIDFPKVEAALTISANAASDGEIIFIVPRNDNTLILGGIAEVRQPKLNLTLESANVIMMRARCEEFLPCLKNGRLDAEYPFAQGLRPARQQNVRVERESRSSPHTGKQSRIIHSYAHGGSGWTLSFGCAVDVAALVKEALMETVITLV